MKIVVVDDQTLIRKGIISILSSQGTMKVCGEASNKKEALYLIEKEKPDLAIVDFQLEHESGLDVITEARKRGCSCKFAVLIHSKDPLTFQHAKAMDVDGYISKDAYPEELIYAVHVIKRGRKYYDPDIIDLLLESQRKPQVDDKYIEQLTSKEKEVLQKIGMGLSNKQIAANLYITENTVKKHVSQVLSKLNLGDRTKAALYANYTGLVPAKHDVLI
ncbi:response regulator transcription factor [Sporosarcina sp. Te-1]|uniref:response regulator n=1 Tax=Sporosarcina sp. Te-1 TaxID=2818390 RepID=UPI001A9F4555|nr:response regulator transcription factor [Sporosarcina sp. Te-1]QTD43516.1 response regulator transcription factor [Sporosarcina sp. Te-1]